MSAYDPAPDADKCYERAVSAETHTEAIATIGEILQSAYDAGRREATERAAKGVDAACVCDEAYRSRQMEDPSCQTHDLAAAIRDGKP